MGQKPGFKDQIISTVGKGWAIPKVLRFTTIGLVVVSALVTGVSALYSLNLVSQRPTESPPSPSPSASPVLRAITALGRLEPQGEVIQLSVPTSLQGARIAEVLVSEGAEIRANQVIAVLDNRDRLQAAVERAEKQVKVAQANLEKVRAGAQVGAIAAQEAKIQRLEAELRGEKDAQQTAINRLETQLQETKQAQDATIQAQEATVRRLEAQLRNVQTDFQRYEQLGRDGAVSQSELENRRLRVETAIEQLFEAQAKLSEVRSNRTQVLTTLTEQLKEAQVNRSKTIDILDAQISEARATLEQIKEVRPVDIQQAQAEVESAIAVVAQARADLELAYVRAPEAGRILKINTRAGETVDEQKGIADLGQTDQMIAIAEVYESDIGKVRLGQRVTLTSENRAFEGELRGSVSQIGLQIGKKDILDTDPAATIDARVVEVKIRLNPEDSKRIAGLTNAKVIVEILL
ncbi:MAG: ABC exporter membrane fusion protein [Coleofasciculus sp. S288]|nr:ABC exporter membrane fusion protein [Coleofasciculus sp. S288]